MNNNDPMSDENHAAQHEYNYFLDKDIQRNLFYISDEVSAQNWTSEYNRITFDSNSLPPPPKTPKGKLKALQKEELCGWSDFVTSPPPAAAVQESGKKTEKSTRLSRDKESSIGWKDVRMREISYAFKHYGDVRKFIEQYRYEHTYNFGPLGREPIEITTCKIIPIGGSETPTPTPSIYTDRHHNPFHLRHNKPISPTSNQTAPELSSELIQNGDYINMDMTSTIPHTQSESNILDMSHKYKFAPDALKEAHTKRTSSPVSIRSVSRSESLQKLPTTRPDSGRYGNGPGPLNGTLRVTPSLVALGAIGQVIPTTSTSQRMTQRPSSPSSVRITRPASPRISDISAGTSSSIKRLMNDSVMNGPIYTKMNYRSAHKLNGTGSTASDKPVLITEKYPGSSKVILAPNSKLKTLDLLSQMADSQMETRHSNPGGKMRRSLATTILPTSMNDVRLPMWFDSTGRAYVSLATRYDPVRK